MTEPSLPEESLFAQALDLSTAAERAAFLDRACADNPALRAEVEALLRAHERSGDVLDLPESLPATTDLPAGEGPGTVVGPYKLLQEIGEGGMGTVWMAEQTRPVQRKVALKIIKAGMDSRQVIARFEAERQALALMDHPHIAKVHDAGTTGAGRPFFVMELVKGVPITRYCDEHRLTPKQRLELFLPVCQAIQHAHQKGIIHRDIKPSNVLVAPYDGRPVVKVIDFGIAKATGQKLTDKTLFTEFGAVVGTLEYMSPEQAELNNQDIDTRSDIYALGVLLYELLTGTTPLEKGRLKEAALLEVLRVIREEEPPRPSTRLSATDELPSIAANRGLEPKKLSGVVRGELDWIVMKALEKDRARRYDTANGFAMDVQRYLNDEPVQACPPSASYRLGKFARRNKAGLAVAGVALFLLVLVGGGGGWVVRDQAARRAEGARLVTEGLNRVQKLQDQSRWAEALAAAQEVEEGLGADSAPGGLAQRLHERLVDLKMVARLEEARLMTAAAISPRACALDIEGAEAEYAKALRDYGLDVDALEPGEAADRIRARPIGLQLAAALDDWSRMRRTLRGESDPAWKHLLAVAQAADADPWRSQLRAAWERKDHEALLKLSASGQAEELSAPALDLLAWRLLDSGAVKEAVDLLREAQRRHPADFAINFDLGYCLALKTQPSRYDEAIRFLTAALALRPRSPAVYLVLGYAFLNNGMYEEAIAANRQAIRLKPDYAMAHNNLGAALRRQGKWDEAVAEYRQAIALDPKLALAHTNFGNALAVQGKLGEAVAEYRQAIALDPNYALAHTDLGSALYHQGKLGEAVAEFRQAVALDPKFAVAHRNLGEGLYDQKKLDEAITEYREAIALDRKSAVAHNNLGNALRSKGHLDEAIAEYREALRLKKDSPEPHCCLGNALREKGQLDEAIAECREALRLKKDFPEAHNNLGNALADKGRLDEAIAEYREALRIKKDYPEAHNNLGGALKDKGRLDEAIAEFHEALRLNKDYAMAHANLGIALKDQGKLDEAIAEFREAVRLKFAPARNNLREAEQLAELTKRLPAVRAGKDQPKDAAERLAFARLCQLYRKEYATAVRFYADAFAAEPKLAEALDGDRYNAACAAALAGCGQGKDAASLDDKERGRLRRQALAWLRADLEVWGRRLDKGPGKLRSASVGALQPWLADPDFAGVRGPEALAKLPDAERQSWQKLWDDVGDLLKRAQGKVTPEKK